jgi:DsbC/DsbD-like thiol-disulfide interchange protein
MIMRSFFLTVAATLAALCTAQAPEPIVAISAPPKNVVAGSKLTLTITVTFATGFHAYQNPPAADYEIPLTVKVDGKEFKVAKVAYPAGVDAAIGGSEKTTKAYEGVIKIPITVVAPTKLGAKTLIIVVGYQQCDESSCFPPSEISKTVKVNVVKKAAKG